MCAKPKNAGAFSSVGRRSARYLRSSAAEGQREGGRAYRYAAAFGYWAQASEIGVPA
ncbi:hypothetical protein [Deinococcus hopiensis]|uniref:hypothetical protein n=1 Tax=Deinococcus hopiensis TaxID=309885 RepID=UPI0014830790|nr:hypothetical protein [Deinococcus hopiensis]